MEMDEWDEFLARGAQEDEEMHRATEEEEKEGKCGSVVVTSDLGDFGDNAEVLMQIARGESFNSLSSTGVFIKSDVNTATKTNTTMKTGFLGKKRMLKSMNNKVSSVPVANTVQDLTRAIIGHPLLSHPLNQQHQRQNDLTSAAREVDSLGLFFYGSTGEVKVDWNGKDDMMKIIEMKKTLLDKSILTDFCENENVSSSLDNTTQCDIIISYENLRLLAECLPPNGKTSWLIPFTVTANVANLTQKSCHKLDPLASLFDYCEKSIRQRIGNLMEESEHVITDDSSFKILVKTRSPPFTVSINFRGQLHVDPVTPANFLFFRQANYCVEVDFDSLRIKAIKSFVPKFEQQDRLFLLLKALKNKITKLEDGNYFLSYQANTPFIKILK